MLKGNPVDHTFYYIGNVYRTIPCLETLVADNGDCYTFDSAEGESMRVQHLRHSTTAIHSMGLRSYAFPRSLTVAGSFVVCERKE